MKRGSTIFLQAVIALFGAGVLVLMLWEPHLEGRNVNATPFEIYFKDPFLAYAYLGSIPFFVGLREAYKALGYVRRDKAFTQSTVMSLRTIRNCALVTACAILAADAYLILAMRGEDDPAGAVMLGIVATIASLVVAAAANVFEQVVRKAVELSTENNLAA